MSRLVFGLFILWMPACAAKASACKLVTYNKADYTVCEFNPSAENIGLYLTHSDGQPYGDFDRVNEDLSAQGDHLAFGMNAGMYHSNRHPVGLFVEAGRERQAISTKPGPGNFHMLPNGVFWIEQFEDDAATYRAAHVASTDHYMAYSEHVITATQSGPMLVIDGALHPKFQKGSDSRKVRNGVGELKDGNLVFVISEGLVNFYDFASFFKDELGSDNALFLDGTISRLYAKDLGRNDAGMPMGPIIGITTSNMESGE